MKLRHLAILSSLLAAACGAPPETPPDGVVVPEGECGHALFVISSDYQSSSVAIVSYEGEVLAAPVLDSGSEAAGLSVALSGDVTAPTARTTSGALILLDRLPAAVVTYFDPEEAAVERQISVQTGFSSNPQDVLELGDSKTYVARYDPNRDPHEQPFDEGSDIVVLDPASAEIVARIDLSPAMEGAAEGTLPRPARLVKTSDHVYVLLAAYSGDFKKVDDGRVAWIDPDSDQVVGHVVLEGLQGCLTMALSPSADRIAVGCSARFGDSEGSGVAILRRDEDGLRVETIVPAEDFGGQPLGLSLAFTADDALLISTVGAMDNAGEPIAPDVLHELDLGSGSTRGLLETEQPFSIGDVRCEPACGVCFVADADRGVVHRMVLGERGRVETLEPIAIDDGIGLPPRYLGAY